MINWEVVGWTCVTIAGLIGIASLVLMFISARNIKKRTSQLKDLHLELKPGKKVTFSGGIYGKIVNVSDETVDVEVAKNTVITVSRFAVEVTA